MASKKWLPGPGTHRPGSRRRRAGRNLPVGLEAAKVVDPDKVDAAQQERKAGSPPRVILGRVNVPPIEWVSPQLAGLTEIVRRYPRNHMRHAVLVELKEIGPSPDVGTVVRHEDRQVTHQHHPVRPARRPQRLPLTLKCILHELVVSDPVCQSLTPRRQSSRLARHQLRLPLIPGQAAMAVLERVIEGVIVQPDVIRADEVSKPLIFAEPVKALCSLPQQFFLEYQDGVEIDFLCRE